MSIPQKNPLPDAPREACDMIATRLKHAGMGAYAEKIDALIRAYDERALPPGLIPEVAGIDEAIERFASLAFDDVTPEPGRDVLKGALSYYTPILQRDVAALRRAAAEQFARAMEAQRAAEAAELRYRELDDQCGITVQMCDQTVREAGRDVERLMAERRRDDEDMRRSCSSACNALLSEISAGAKYDPDTAMELARRMLTVQRPAAPPPPAAASILSELPRQAAA